MSAKKLGRLAGLVLALVVLAGGAAAGGGGRAAASEAAATQASTLSTLEYVWN
ncbi:hypothetical protein [Actinoplanes regularis]|uniref:Uncharacterized protein n=1 Tax=Actinoplanes regularis TaxID=52697 RepID=A0A238X9R9_9ACTN|nr:hypothetical protein [Actinoplanes regularis]GIE86577.1 hypothetical protein Are01nite_30570 [Actinoplanes regularis]SNR55460.1 hypothetical protein SAMN06264365_103203 [Actinoplanes regularis]